LAPWSDPQPLGRRRHAALRGRPSPQRRQPAADVRLRNQARDGPGRRDQAEGRAGGCVCTDWPAGGGMTPRPLIACIGNIFLGDDAFGVEVSQRLARVALPDGVRVVDFGIRSLDLAYALLDEYEAVILVDAAPRGGAPGTLYVVEISPSETAGKADEVLA